MLIGILSGTYSSIFIASPVLTAWKEREPDTASAAAISSTMNTSPGVPQQNVVARSRTTTRKATARQAEPEPVAAPGAPAPGA